MLKYGRNIIGENSRIFDPTILGFPSRDNLDTDDYVGCVIGSNAIIRPGATIYADVTIGDFFSSGHNIFIREHTVIGSHVSLGTNVIIEGYSILGDYVNLQSLVYVPTHSTIGSHVFIGPNSVLTNDRYPPHGGDDLSGPVIEDYASIGANVTILPGVRIGQGSLVAAGSVVTKDIPPRMLAIGSPARVKDLPKGAVRI
ncbi:MAG: N-acetyltransferase [Methanomicrobiales archaeon HGW-Methanomicrobiales-4]|nr:MAG: N-acetyltransferase [Methanomicrobiales archaeon HGW-Methanomicrobiales-4]